MELDQEQKNKLMKLGTFLEKTEVSQLLPFHDLLEEIRDHLKMIAEKEMPEMEMPEQHKVEIMGAELVTIKGEKGDSPTDEHLVELITPLIPKPVAGKDGYTPKKNKDYFDGIDGKDGLNAPQLDEIVKTVFPLIPTPKDGKDGSSDLPSQIVDKINSLPTDDDELKINKDHIRGLYDIIKELEIKISSIPRGGGSRKGGMEVYDLSPLTDGLTKVFTVPKSRTGFVISSDFPTVLMKGNGFTLNATTTQLTLTPDNAPSLSSQLLYVYSSIFNT